MDPCTAFSLVCGVIQLVDTGMKVVSKCQELHRTGALGENNDIEDMARRLEAICNDMDSPTIKKSTDAITASDDATYVLVKKCSATVRDLLSEIQKLKIVGRRKKRHALSKVIKGLWKMNYINGIQTRLDSYRKELDTNVLINLRERVDFTNLQQSSDFQTLDGKIQALMTSLAQRLTTFGDLRCVISTDGELTRAHVSSHLQDFKSTLAAEDYRKRFMDSLWFPEIQRRQGTVAEAHEKTFEWIFDSYRTAHPWDNFIKWLESGQGTYWINGKPGAGKSTLMRYILEDDRTLKSLKVWSHNEQVYNPAFFFWNAGSNDLEKSTEGMVRSFIWQIMESSPELLPTTSHNDAKSGLPSVTQRKYPPIAAWTGRRLHDALQDALDQTTSSNSVCFFIDGLDEACGSHDKLAASIEDLLKSDKVKICLSSRPERSFSEAYCSSASLRLQDLTEPDIRNYVYDKLQDFIPTECEFPGDKRKQEIAESIVQKAEGVFLWVQLVVDSQIRGLRCGDNIELLTERLHSIPSDVEDLFTQMLTRMERVHQPEAAFLVQMTLAHATFSLLDYALALQYGFRKTEFPRKKISVEQANSLCKATTRRILTIHGGFLDVRQEVWDASKLVLYRADRKFLSPELGTIRSPEMANLAFHECYSSVRFIHRAAADFFKNSRPGTHFLRAFLDADSNLHVAYVRALLAKVLIFGLFTSRVDDVNGDPRIWFVDRIMLYTAMNEEQASKAKYSLCKQIEGTLNEVAQQRGFMTTQSHWTSQMGFMASCGARIDRQIEQFTSPYLDPQASPTNSEQPIAQRSSVCHATTIIPTAPVDFLGFAASYGLFYYVSQELDQRDELSELDRELVQYLICCAIGAFERCRDLSIGSLGLTAELLRRGGNPRFWMEISSSTLWSIFLQRMADPTWGYSPHFEGIPTIIWANTVRAFLDADADVHEVIWEKHKLKVIDIDDVVSKDGARLASTVMCYYHLHFTPLNVLEELFAEQAEVSELLAYFKAKGARSSRICTHMGLIDPDGKSAVRTLSGQQSSDFVAALQSYNRSCHNRNRERPLGFEIMKIFKGASAKASASDDHICRAKHTVYNTV